jgi:hypothetical protein
MKTTSTGQYKLNKQEYVDEEDDFLIMESKII